MNPGDEASASDYETTRGSWEKLRIFFFSCRARCLAQDGAAEVERWRGWRWQRTGRRGRQRAFRRIALGQGARAKSGLRRQGKIPVAVPGSGALSWQEFFLGVEGLVFGGLVFVGLGVESLGVDVE